MRSLTAPFFSLIVTLVLFYTIAQLIYNQPTPPKHILKRPQLSILPEFDTSTVEDKKKASSEPPPPKTAAPASPSVKMPGIAKSKLPAYNSTLSMSVPAAVGESFNLNSPFLGKPGQGGSANQEIVPLVRVPPIYPRRAAIKGIEGWVKVEFTVLETGDVANVTVLSAKPRRIFDRAAINAISSWKFRPKISNGKPVKERATQIITFKLSE
jgi:protein TonB